MFSFALASRLNSSNSRCSKMILENCPGRHGCDSDEDRSECQPLFFGNSEIFEKEHWQRRSTGIIVLLLRLKRLIHHATAGSGGVRRRRRMRKRKMWRGRRDPARKWGLSAALQKSAKGKKEMIKSPSSWYFLTQRKCQAFYSHLLQWFIILFAPSLLILTNESTILTISPTILVIF